MKKIKYTISVLMLAMFFTVMVEVKSINDDTKQVNKIQKTFNNKITTKGKPVIQEGKKNFSELKSISIEKIEGKYYLDDTELDTQYIKETVENGLIIIEYKDKNYNILKSVYKKIDETKGYAHIKNIVVVKLSVSTETTTYNFRYNITNYSNTLDLKAGNATNNYELSTAVKTFEEYLYNSKEEIVYYYKNNTLKILDVYAVNTYEYIKNTRYLTSKSTIYVKNKDVVETEYLYKNSNEITTKIITYHNNALSKFDYEGEVFFIYDYSTQERFEYNSKMQITLHNITKTFDGYDVETYREEKSYHSNGKIKQKTMYNYNSHGVLVSAHKIKYSSNGKKYSYKVRSFKNGNVTKQKYYRYNKYGLLKKGAYRKTVVYYKAKAYKAYSNTYNSKGKISKAKTIKLTKTISKW